MSRSCRIRINLSVMPQPTALQSQLKAQGYKLDLECLDLANASGFHGCVLDGEDAGFSISADDEGLMLRWSGDIREEVAALMTAATVQALTGAEIHIGAGAPLNASALKARLDELLDEM